MNMKPRDRVLCALNHEEPDRVPLFIGTSGVTSVLGPAYPKLLDHMGIRGDKMRFISKAFQYVWMDEEVMARLGSDGRPVAPGPAVSPRRDETREDRLVDEWGCTWEKHPTADYFEMLSAPLGNATLDDLNRYPWPDLTHPSRFEGLAGRCQAIQKAGYASVLMTGVSTFERVHMLRGLENCLMDLVADPDFYLALQDKVKQLTIPYLGELFRQAGPYVDVAVMADDLGAQQSTLMSPEVYRRFIKPHQADMIAVIKEHSGAKVFLHSCGNIYPLIGDLIEIGVDVLNPVQVSCGAMGDTARLKREFGRHLSFCGGIDTGCVMNQGTEEDVRREVRRRIRDLAPGGGYVAAAVHCLQPDVPPENIVTMCAEVASAGRYPLRV